MYLVTNQVTGRKSCIWSQIKTVGHISNIWSDLRVAECEVWLLVVLELALLPGLQEVLLQVEHLALVAHVHPSVPVLLAGRYVPAMSKGIQ